jgi:nitrogen fixation/metabolism regulation signal transduction histidine kinase
VSTPPQYPPAPLTPSPYAAVPMPAAQNTNVLAIVSLVLAFFVSLGAIVTGHIALTQIRRTGERGHGLALAGVILGYIGLVLGFIAILAAIAIPAFLNQRVNAWDASVKSDLGNAAIAAANYSVANDGSFVGTPPMTLELLESDYGLYVTPGNTLTMGTVTASSFVITGSNERSGAGHTYTLTTGTISGPG